MNQTFASLVKKYEDHLIADDFDDTDGESSVMYRAYSFASKEEALELRDAVRKELQLQYGDDLDEDICVYKEGNEWIVQFEADTEES
jgi:hypothetical protein